MQAQHKPTRRDVSPTSLMDSVDVLVVVAVLAAMALIVLL